MEGKERETGLCEAASPNSEPIFGSCRALGSRLYPCLSVFICGFQLHKYELALLGDGGRAGGRRGGLAGRRLGFRRFAFSVRSRSLDALGRAEQDVFALLETALDFDEFVVELAALDFAPFRFEAAGEIADLLVAF